LEPSALASTRRALHGVAELVIAGPQFAAHGDIRLQVRPGGIAGRVSKVCIEGGDIVWDGGRTGLAGTCRSLAEAAGLTAEAPGVDDVVTFFTEGRNAAGGG
jgi:hypothetical protein